MLELKIVWFKMIHYQIFENLDNLGAYNIDYTQALGERTAPPKVSYGDHRRRAGIARATFL